jgi:hypothetical protein
MFGFASLYERPGGLNMNYFSLDDLKKEIDMELNAFKKEIRKANLRCAS